MNPTEYIQLRAFARNDGAYLAVLWIVSFACICMGMKTPFLGTLGTTMAFLSPFFICRRIQSFRDHVREGELSYWNGYIYSMSMFFYASLLFAIIQYAYFAFIDGGSFFATSLDQARQILLANKYPEKEINAAIEEYRSMRPIDWALYFMSMNIIIGGVASIIIAAITRKKTKENKI
ncbi:MAG: DUF4199 domain-containing protein [Prevotella sp.]|nr:DUF4199 domain-containing protein [Prevotella sp.]